MNEEVKYAPIVLFVYNRPGHTRKTLEALQLNQLADKSVLYVYADGAKADASQEQLQGIAEVRSIVREQQWCSEVRLIERETNMGLADNIIAGVTEVVNLHGRIIVLEDDLITSKGFLQYMNDALELYKDEERVMHISGYMYPIKLKEKTTVFLNVATPWGWATWKRAWNFFERNPLELKLRIQNYPLFSNESFNSGFGNEFTWQLEKNVTGEIKTWAVLWHSSIFLRQGYCLHPVRTLIFNIGFDGSGIHCKDEPNRLQQKIIDFIRLRLEPIVVKEETLRAFKNYYLSFSNTTKLSIFKRILTKFKIKQSG